MHQFRKYLDMIWFGLTGTELASIGMSIIDIPSLMNNDHETMWHSYEMFLNKSVDDTGHCWQWAKANDKQGLYKCIEKFGIFSWTLNKV